MAHSTQSKKDPEPLRRVTVDLGAPLGQAMVVEMDDGDDPNFEAEPMRAGDDASMLGCFGCVVAAAEALYGLKNLEPECVTCFLGTVHSEVAGDVPGAYFSFSADDGESYFQAMVAPADGEDVSMIWLMVTEGDSPQ
jgi:hypothetical protein